METTENDPERPMNSSYALNSPNDVQTSHMTSGPHPNVTIDGNDIFTHPPVHANENTPKANLFMPAGPVCSAFDQGISDSSVLIDTARQLRIRTASIDTNVYFHGHLTIVRQHVELSAQIWDYTHLLVFRC